MDENNKYCACTGTDAMFHIKLNQQGPEGKQGPQGIQGIDGISPSITVENSTQNNYQLRVSTAYNTFVTPNLKGDDKVQIDPWILTKPGDIPEFGLNKTVTNSDIIDGVVTIPGGLGFSININDNAVATHSINTKYKFPIITTLRENGVVVGKSTSYLLTNNSIIANDPIMLTRNKDGSVTLDFDDTNYQHKLIAGSNINISNNTISVTGMPTKVSELTNDAGYLTSIPSEYVTESELAAKDYVTNTELDNKGYVTQSSLSLKLDEYATKEELSTTNTTVANLQTSVESNTTSIGSIRESIGNLTNSVVRNATDIASLEGTKLESSNIIAGANIAIDRSGNNLTISSTGGGGIQINDETPSTETVYSSNKVEDLLMNYVPTSTYNTKVEELTNLISSLTDRVTALETEINGGNA